jgi:ABC-2 type transport system permease protein
MKNVLLVAKREYRKVVLKPSFWFTTFAFPIFLIAISLISGLSADSAEAAIKKQAENAKLIYILDQTSIGGEKLIDPSLIKAPYQFTDNFDSALADVKSGKANTLIQYPADFLESKKINIYAQDLGVLGTAGFNNLADQLVKQSILLKTKSADLIGIFNSQYNMHVTSYKDGVEVVNGLQRLVVPGVAIVIYFVFTTFATSYLLLSVSEEKENRMIETILSIIKPKDLVWGKIIGQVGVILTQILVLAICAVLAVVYLTSKGSLDLTGVTITPLQIIAAIFYSLCGFLILANVMVGAGAAMPSYKEAQQLSGLFIFASMAPVYLVTSILAEPSGNIAKVLSYLPFTSPIILLFRNALGELSLTEVLISSALLIVYVLLSFYLSFKLFELGALEYSNKISFKGFLNKLRKR